MVCRIAEAIGVAHVIIPGLAAVFSAFGIGFSDVAHEYAAPLAGPAPGDLAEARRILMERARHGMFAEGGDLADCDLQFTLSAADGEDRVPIAVEDSVPEVLRGREGLSLALRTVKHIVHPLMAADRDLATHEAVSAGRRNVSIDAGAVEAPLYRVEKQRAGAAAAGPAVLEEAFFTCRVDVGWRFRINAAGDILLDRVEERAL